MSVRVDYSNLKYSFMDILVIGKHLTLYMDKTEFIIKNLTSMK